MNTPPLRTAVTFCRSATGGDSALLGISGPSGSLTTVELVGKNSPNPNKQLYKDDWNNFAPAVGWSWSLPWWGKDKTVLRAGYGISYTGALRNYIGVGGILREAEDG